MSDFRTKIDEQTGAGVRFEVHECRRKSHALTRPVAVAAPGGSASSPTIHVHLPHPATARQVRIVLDGGAALLEPGALQYAHGKLSVDIQKNAGAGGFFQRAVTSAGSGESAFATRYAGHGEVWTELTGKYFILASMDGPQDSLILDDGAFYACDATAAT